MVRIDSSPASALITVNGQVLGSAPVNLPVEIDADGDVARDLDLTANFADSFGLPQTANPPVVNFRIERGERAPSVVNFDTESASAR